MIKTSSNRNNCYEDGEAIRMAMGTGCDGVTNSILASGILQNDVAFARDVPEVLASECGADQQVPHYYITLPALGPLWCS